MTYEYHVLRDLPNRGTIVRTKGQTQERYKPGGGWVETGILTRYFNDESDYYDLYDEITEEEAFALIEESEV